MNNNIFFEQMALTTAIVNEDIAYQIRDIYLSKVSFNEKMKAIREKFVLYLIEEDKNYLSIPHQLEQYKCQLNLDSRLEHFIQATSASNNEVDDSIDSEFQEGLVFEGIIATVDWFDAEIGYGFVDIEGVDGQVFLHAQQLSESGIEFVSDGDELLSDVGRNAKGLHITQVHDIETELEGIEIADCRIIRVFDDRGYGFVQIADGSRDAFFHFSVVPSTDRIKLKVGIGFQAQIKADKIGRGLQVKKVISFLESAG